MVKAGCYLLASSSAHFLFADQFAIWHNIFRQMAEEDRAKRSEER